MKVNDELVSSFPKEYVFDSSTQVTLQAVPDPGFLFFRWSGTNTATSDNPIMVTVDCDTDLFVTFNPMLPVITIAAQGKGSISPYTGENTYGPGTVVKLKANPAMGWKFASWTGNVADPASPQTTLTVNSDARVVSTFSRTWLWPIYWIIPGVLIAGGGLAWLTYANRKSLKRSFRKL